jgi:flagellar motility protein MotE (MotC chaperone)
LTETILTESGSQLLGGFLKYVQMEMKLPSLNILAKVDTGIKRRSGASSKEFRKSSSKQKSRTLTTKIIQDLRDLSHTQSSRAHKPRNEVSLKLIVDSEDLNKPSDIENKNEFMKILEEIKKEELQEIVVDEYEGGSDS